MAAPTIIGKLIEHYQVVAPLASGGMGQVYQAYDTRLGRFVALKFLPEFAAGSQSALDRFIREARAASALNHPNIITIYDIGETAETGRFLVLEFIEGRTLRELLKHQISLESLLDVATQVLKAIASAHAVGIVHRDIKPENIMVRSDGYVKVLDFGLARLVPTTLPESFAETKWNTMPGTLVGTCRYMSPEQARGEPATSASDVFSLGIVLYELGTRQHPFDAGSQVGVLHAILSQVPIPVGRLNPEIPPTLEAIIISMLQKDPRLRPTAEELQLVLADLSARKMVAKPSTAVSILKHQIVGRHEELAQLRTEFEFAESGRGVVLCVAGEPGLGKTALIEHFLAELARGRPTVSVGRGRCSERLAGTGAYLPFLEAFESLLHGERNQPLIRIMKLTAPAWYFQVAPHIENSSSSTRLLTEPIGASQESLKRELLAFLKEASLVQPVVLFLDDLHWADLSTVDLLAYVGNFCDSMRVLIVLTYRPSDLLLSKHAFHPVKLDLQARGVCREIILTTLTGTDVEQYLALQFPGHSFPEDFMRLIHARTEGNPLFMVDLVRYLRDRKVVGEEHGCWMLLNRLADIKAYIPESIRSMIQRKVDQLSDTDRKLLGAAAVQGYEFDSAVVGVALKSDFAEVEERLELLDRVYSLVRLKRQQEFPNGILSLRYRFVHALYQNALYNSLGPARKATVSATIARSLITYHGKRSNDIATELALLFETARDFSQATYYFLIAAQSANKVFANKEAVVLSQRGLDLIKKMPEGAETAERELMLQITLGVPLMATKGYGAPEVETTYRRARELCLQLHDESQFGATLWGLFVFHLVRAELSTAREIAGEILSMAEQAQDSALLMTAHWAMGITLVSLGELTAGQESLEQGIALYDPKKHPTYSVLLGLDPGIRLRCEWVRSLWLLGHPDEALERSRETIRMAQELNHPPNLAFPLIFCAMIHQLRREPGPAQERAEAAIALSKEHGMPQFLAWGITWQGWAMAQQGRTQEGILQIQRSLEAYATMRFHLNRPHLLSLLAEALTKSGRLAEALATLDEALEIVRTAGADYYNAELYRLKGELILAQSTASAKSAFAEAEACFRQAVTIARQQGAKCFELRAATALSGLWQRAGNNEAALNLLAPIYASLTEGFDTPDMTDAQAMLEQLN